ncbi:unnamed protein product [Tilletia laevis]|nr:hypothetical protein CF336_g4164 [Tilletia laevis]KAE8202624.1 hypothetical protein CF335_g3343 [Tilletia laevis]KAE8262908.1 hypothetical protein A4X03_0g2082 [Tilletia caries]CAD6955753.1 unnamed protein product [Tilletia laevis]
MPAIVQEDERRAARLRHPRSLQRALKLADDAQAEEILADLLKDQSEGENFSLTPTDIQTRLIDFALEAQEWHEEYYIPQHATGAFGNELQIPSDFFDYDSVPGLVHRATLFMSFKRKFCSAHSGIGRPSIHTLKNWAHMLIANARLRIQRNSTADEAPKTLRRVLRYSGTGENGLYQRVHTHLAAMVQTYNLPISIRRDSPWGRLEVELVIDCARRSMTHASGQDVTEAMLQRLCLILLCYQTGLRIGSLATGPQGTDGLSGFRHEHLRFRQVEPGHIDTQLHIETLKGWRNLDRREINPLIFGARELRNLHLDPGPPLLALLLHRKALYIKGAAHPLTSVDELMSSSALEFEGRGTTPVFRLAEKNTTTLTEKPMSPSDACDFLRLLATKVGVTLSGFHQIRKGFAQNITVALGPDVTRTALDHNMKENTLDRHYTTGVGIYDFARIRYGESLDAAITERVAASTMKANEMFGQAMKAMAGGSRVDAKLGTRPQRENGYIKEQLLKDPEYKIAQEELETQKQKLEAESGISFEGLKSFGQQQMKRARTALEALEKPTDIVDATLEAIERERKLRIAKRSAAERRLQEEATQKTRSSMTREGLATATDAVVQAERKRIAALEDAIAAHIQRMADASLPTEKEGVAPQPHSVDHRLLSKVSSSGHAGPSGSNRHDTTTEVQDEFEGDVTEADILTIPHRVQKISSVDDAGSEAKVNFDTTTARLALIRSLAGMLQSCEVEAAIRSLMERTGLCMFCNPQQGMGNSRQRSLEHLLKFHRGILCAIRVGAPLHPGLIANPLFMMGNAVNQTLSPWVASSSELTRKYIAPPSPDADKVAIAPWLGGISGIKADSTGSMVSQKPGRVDQPPPDRLGRYLSPSKWNDKYTKSQHLPFLRFTKSYIKFDGAINTGAVLQLSGPGAPVQSPRPPSNSNKASVRQLECMQIMPPEIASAPLGARFADR